MMNHKTAGMISTRIAARSSASLGRLALGVAVAFAITWTMAPTAQATILNFEGLAGPTAPMPVGFGSNAAAASTGISVANPISDVLSELSINIDGE